MIETVAKVAPPRGQRKFWMTTWLFTEKDLVIVQNLPRPFQLNELQLTPANEKCASKCENQKDCIFFFFLEKAASERCREAAETK